MNTETWIVLFTMLACIAGLVCAITNYLRVAKIKMRKRRAESPKKKKIDPTTGEKEKSIENERTLAEADYDKLVRAGDIISSSATVYLLQEYGILATFILAFGLLLYVFFLYQYHE